MNMNAQVWSIDQLPGIPTEIVAQLQAVDIINTRQLLQCCPTLPATQELATRLSLPLHHVRKWVALADLAQITEIGCTYAGVLLHAGVASTHQLAQLPAHRLHRQILKLYVATFQDRESCPDATIVRSWVASAKQLNR